MTNEDRFEIKQTERLHSVVFRVYYKTEELEVVLEDLPFYNALVTGKLYEQEFSIETSDMTPNEIIDVFTPQYDSTDLEEMKNWDEQVLETAIKEAWERKEDDKDYK